MSGGPDVEGVLLRMIELAYAAPDDDAMIGAVFETMRQVIPFSSGIFMPVNQATMELQAGPCFDCCPADMARYLAHYAAMDPFVLRQPGPTKLNRNLLLSDVVSPAELAQSEFSDFLEQVPYFHATGMLAGVGQQPVAVVSIHRRRHKHDFNVADKGVLDCIGQHLARAVVLRRLASHSLSRTETGLAVFDPGGHALYLNAPARRFLGTTPPGALAAAAARHGGEGVIQLGSQAFRLGRLPWSAASLLRRFACADAAADIFGWRPPDADPAVTSAARATARQAGSSIIVLRPLLPRTDLQHRLTRYGLSPRQCEIAGWALRGRTNGEIAQELNIGEQTVRDHFQEIYARIGAHSRNEMVARVLGMLASPLPTSKRGQHT
ncbi:MAG: HTH-type quorum sensing-dependent transcriptional regulator RpaR [Accumulibacter sp.]|uniref:helix-turn-helix transcriptional regulator n=1 Tax=Accumulibacter sp. TaxID=2053492 RepID=UPI001220FD4B|nr:LuxR C-terminal-related transcriptional regulator [Accumulibacter sp.]TLD45003.1 MAG: HTH-type quorum sensing-dependent transcriptional regulator RpaR [Accumulibacter sp.]